MTVEIQELKETLASLILSDLEQLGIEIEEIDSDDTVQLYSTTDDYCHARNEATWISAVNNEDVNFLIIAQGTLYDERAKQETGREVEVGRVFVDENKAEMLIDALYHAFPDLVCDQVYSALEDEETSAEQDDKEEELKNLDTRIGDLRRELTRLERIRSKCEVKNPADSDGCIDTYQRIKAYNGSLKDETAEPEVVKRKETVLFVSGFKDKKIIKLTEANINHITNEKLGDVSPKHITKTILIDKKLAKALAKVVTQTF